VSNRSAEPASRHPEELPVVLQYPTQPGGIRPVLTDQGVTTGAAL
jgi:hypothetical protein